MKKHELKLLEILIGSLYGIGIVFFLHTFSLDFFNGDVRGGYLFSTIYIIVGIAFHLLKKYHKEAGE